MSYQKKRTHPTTLTKGARGCNKPSIETRAEKLARKGAIRERFHAAAQDYDHMTAIMAGTRWVRGRNVDRHEYLPHQSDREVARRLRQQTSA